MDRAAVEGRRRRIHSAQFKTQVMQACRQPGVSVASVALSHGLNANLVRRWLSGRDTGCGNAVALEAAQAVQRAAAGVAATFVPVQLGAADPTPRDIRLELRRGAATIVVNWPAREAAACGSWLREWLR
ncbi:MAG TPA: transposase [Candidatus Limnocylindrales bacterium]|nr:transposase [Candidatus Limnocylindrales bacterium]